MNTVPTIEREMAVKSVQTEIERGAEEHAIRSSIAYAKKLTRREIVDIVNSELERTR